MESLAYALGWIVVVAVAVLLLYALGKSLIGGFDFANRPERMAEYEKEMERCFEKIEAERGRAFRDRLEVERRFNRDVRGRMDALERRIEGLEGGQ